jgi:hypothetical protein
VNLGPAGGELQDFVLTLRGRSCRVLAALSIAHSRRFSLRQPGVRKPKNQKDGRRPAGIGPEPASAANAASIPRAISGGLPRRASSLRSALPLDASSAPADLRRRFNRENPEALEQMRQADRDAEGAVELRSRSATLAVLLLTYLIHQSRCRPAGKATTRPDSNRSRIRLGRLKAA